MYNENSPMRKARDTTPKAQCAKEKLQIGICKNQIINHKQKTTVIYYQIHEKMMIKLGSKYKQLNWKNQTLDSNLT